MLPLLPKFVNPIAGLLAKPLPIASKSAAGLPPGRGLAATAVAPLGSVTPLINDVRS